LKWLGKDGSNLKMPWYLRDGKRGEKEGTDPLPLILLLKSWLEKQQLSENSGYFWLHIRNEESISASLTTVAATTYCIETGIDNFP
jgi:hypothetical protein